MRLRALFKHRRAVVDTLRRQSELLEGVEPRNCSTYWYEEREHIQAVARRIVRAVDPGAESDRTVR
jgi:hypothetical protein